MIQLFCRFRSWSLFVLLNIALSSNAQNPSARQVEWLTYPFSQLVVRNDWAAPIVWKYGPFKDIIETETVIAPPNMTDYWNDWFRKMKTYQTYLREHLNDTSSSYLEVNLKKGNDVRLTYKRVLNQIRLLPNDKISFDGYAKNEKGISNFRVNLIYIKSGQELSHSIVKSETVGTISISENSTSLQSEFVIPDFDSKNLMVQPAVFFYTNDTNAIQVNVHGLRLSIPASKQNLKIYNEQKASFYPKNAGTDKQLYQRPETQWVKRNFISGFAYLWDNDFWDADKKVFTAQKYCDKMKREFGGFQSVLIWIGYPNIGIDNHNIWDILAAIPGGINAVRAVVKVFHKNNVKVYFPYMPWEIDTRRTGTPDATHWGKMVEKTDADGLFFDTWFDGDSFQKELDKYKRGVSIGTEHHPTLQNVQGYNAITTSWGQTLTPYNNNGISRVKWLIPEHLQWTINRWTTDRQNNMAYSWINGQGILVWENIFGHMNIWNAKDRHTLRKINAIYQQFGYLYTSDSWKPYLPSGNENVHISSWQNKEARIWNIISDKEDIILQMDLLVDDDQMEYYDLWTGKKLNVTASKITLVLKRFSCVLGLKSTASVDILKLIRKHRKEDEKIGSIDDVHGQYVSTKSAKPVPVNNSSATVTTKDLLQVAAGKYILQTSHVKRECGCFVDDDAKNNNDNNQVKNATGADLIVHHTNVSLAPFQIMERTVTNEAFELFLKSSNYHPVDKINFLKHWKGMRCPDSLRSRPVVYVSLDDVRAYAKWAGMRLPTEWEWQVAGETHGKEFVFNEVWEWNESERFDGHNWFVTLRGGCANWTLQTSRWYFPGTANNNSPGGEQPLDSHSKFFIMKTGFDRAGTIGFRCVK